MAYLFVNIIGHNASGKSTLAKKLKTDLGFNRVNGDDFRLFVKSTISYFSEIDPAKPTDRLALLDTLTVPYRISMSTLLLRSGQNVMFEGSGFTKAHRAKYLDLIHTEFPSIKRVIILCQLNEDEHLQRLKAREATRSDTAWQDQYAAKKHMLELPTEEECELTLTYDQLNYDFIKKTLQDLQQ